MKSSPPSLIFQDEEDDDDYIPPPPKEPHPDDVPKEQDVPGLRGIKTPERQPFPQQEKRKSKEQQKVIGERLETIREFETPITKIPPPTIQDEVPPPPKRPPPKCPATEEEKNKQLTEFQTKLRAGMIGKSGAKGLGGAATSSGGAAAPAKSAEEKRAEQQEKLKQELQELEDTHERKKEL